MKKVSTIKKKAWDFCSKYIRLKYSDKNGFVKCYTCSTIKFYKEMQAGHGFGGRGNSILFDERIVRPQCAPCNVWKYGNYDVFKIKLEKEYGFKFMEQMLKQKNKLKQFSLKEITAIHDKFKKLYELELSKKDLL
jgi:hypothetical protein